MLVKLLLKILFTCIYCVVLGYPIPANAQSKKFTQEEIDRFEIKPLNRKNLQVFRKILLDQPGLKGWTKYYASYSYYMAYQQEQDSAIFYAKNAIEEYRESTQKHPNEEKSLLHAYYAMGRAFYDKKEYQISTASLLNCLQLAKKYPFRIKGYLFSSLANNHLALGNDSLALSFYKKALRDSLFTTRPQSLITVLSRIGVLYGTENLDKADSAKFYYHKAVAFSLKLNYNNSLATLYGNLGDIFKQNGNIDSTIYYYSRAQEILKQYKPVTAEASIKTPLYNIANYSYVKIHSGKLDEGISDLNMVLDSLDKYPAHDKNDRGLFLTTYENLVIAYQKKKDFKKMMQIVQRKEAFLNQFHKTQLRQELEELQVQFETREKQSEIERLENLTENQQIIQRQQKIIFTGIVVLLLIFFLVVWFYFYQRNLNMKYKSVVLQQQLLRTQMDPHFLFNALNAVVILNKEEPGKVEQYVLSLSKLVRRILENSREEFVPLEKEVDALENYLLLQSNFYRKFGYAINMSPKIEPEHYYVPPMMIQPFVENAIIHGIASKKQKGKILVSFSTNNGKHLVCDIEDNGIGYGNKTEPKMIRSKDHTSLSERILRERLAIYNRKFKAKATLVIEDLENAEGICTGTRVRIVLPVDFA